MTTNVTYGELRHCATCAQERVFEGPTCADGHDADCPDLACAECGTAIFFGVLPRHCGESSSSRTHVAPAA